MDGPEYYRQTDEASQADKTIAHLSEEVATLRAEADADQRRITELCCRLTKEEEDVDSLRAELEEYKELAAALNMMNLAYKTQAFHRPMDKPLDRLRKAREAIAARSEGDG